MGTSSEWLAKVWLVYTFLICQLVGCGSDPASPSVSDSEESHSTEITQLLAVPSEIGFSEVNRLVFQTSCNECHNSKTSGGSIDFSDYHSVVESPAPNLIMRGEPNESRLYTSMMADRGARQMPPRNETKLTEQQKQLVYQWILRGAPETSTSSLEFTSLEEKLEPFFAKPETIDYAVVKEWVFEPGRCFDCHSETGYRKSDSAILFGVDMTQYSRMFLRNGIVPGQPEHITNEASGNLIVIGSRIYDAVGTNQSMPPASQGFQPLSEQRVKLLRLWILNCAIEDADQEETDTLIFSSRGSDKVRNCY